MAAGRGDRYLFLGGSRSGKSRIAQALAEWFGAPSGRCVLVATAQGLDDEMAERIERHRSLRDPGVWHTIEEPLLLADALMEAMAEGPKAVVVDCLTLWTSNLLCLLGEAALREELKALHQVLGQVDIPLILVSNEVGQGIVPTGAISRLFRDWAGLVNQVVAARCDNVILTVAGIPSILKGGLPEGFSNARGVEPELATIIGSRQVEEHSDSREASGDG